MHAAMPDSDRVAGELPEFPLFGSDFIKEPAILRRDNNTAIAAAKAMKGIGKCMLRKI